MNPDRDAILDAHHHLWDLSRVHYPWLMAKGERRFFGNPAPIQRDYLVDEFRDTASAHGVRASVHIQVGAADGLAEARWVDSVASANPGWPAKQVAFADLASEGVESILNHLADIPSVCGIRQIVGRSPAEDAATGTNDLLASARFRDGLQMLAERALRFDLQLIPGLMESTARLLERVTDLPVALCHAGSPHDWSATGLKSWSLALRALAERPRTVCKLSGLGMFEPGWSAQTIHPIVETCLEQFGAERCMFGSNFPVDSLTGSYEDIVSAYRQLIPSDWHRQVFWDTAAEFYDIGGTVPEPTVAAL